jgi:hypothetical protein
LESHRIISVSYNTLAQICYSKELASKVGKFSHPKVEEARIYHPFKRVFIVKGAESHCCTSIGFDDLCLFEVRARDFGACRLPQLFKY